MVQLNSILALGALFASTARAVTPLVVDGADFVNAIDGKRFQMIGVAYQPGGAAGYNPENKVDPLSDADVCMRDAILMQRLGINTLRVYNLDPALDHTECASIFNAAGIYMVLDVNSPLPNESLNRVAPWENYNKDYMERVFQVIESFKNFNNTLGFFSANEIINEQSVAQVPQYVRAVTRDIKDYIKNHASRSIPVGYSAADVRPLLHDTFAYFSCNIQQEESSKIDFFGLNSYSWCGDSSFTTSEYDILVEDFSNTTIPIFFSEYGCNKVTPRTFTEVGALYGSQMTGVFSGGIVYEYSEEPNEFGLLVINQDNSVKLKEDYNNLREEYNKIDLVALTTANSTATGLNAPTCDSSMITSNLTSNFTVPTRLSDINDMVNNGVGGNWPAGTTQVTNTKEPAKVFDPNGNEITGLELKILANDQSNLPGNNTSGTDGSGGPGVNGSNNDNAARRIGGSNFSVTLLSAVALSFFAFLL